MTCYLTCTVPESLQMILIFSSECSPWAQHMKVWTKTCCSFTRQCYAKNNWTLNPLLVPQSLCLTGGSNEWIWTDSFCLSWTGCITPPFHNYCGCWTSWVWWWVFHFSIRSPIFLVNLPGLTCAGSSHVFGIGGLSAALYFITFQFSDPGNDQFALDV